MHFFHEYYEHKTQSNILQIYTDNLVFFFYLFEIEIQFF